MLDDKHFSDAFYISSKNDSMRICDKRICRYHRCLELCGMDDECFTNDVTKVIRGKNKT